MLACADKVWHIHSTDFVFCWGMASARYLWLQAPMSRTSYLLKVFQYVMSTVKNCACLDTTFYVYAVIKLIIMLNRSNILYCFSV